MPEIKEIETPKQRWTRETVQPALRKAPERKAAFTTASGRPVERLYAAEDLVDRAYDRDIQDPGVFPFVRGGGDGGWTITQGVVAGTPERANQRLRELVAAGAAGLHVALDRPTALGLDPDHARARGAVGRAGVSVASLADMARLFDGIPLDRVRVHLAADAAAPVLFAIYLALAETRGVAWTSLQGGTSADVIGARWLGREDAFPPPHAERLVAAAARFAADAAPAWRPVVIDGARLREAGATAVQELAIVLALAAGDVERAVAAGVAAEVAARSVSAMLGAGSDFFEEIAKFRAARALWAATLRDRFGVAPAAAPPLRLQAWTDGTALSARQPYNNVVRTAIQAMAAVLGGADGLQASPLDRPLGGDGREAATLAMRTQQIVAHESGVAKAVDPLGGAYFVEALTADLERAVRAEWDAIEAGGADGVRTAIATSAARAADAVAAGDRVVVGVNDFVQADEPAAAAQDGPAGEAAESAQVEQVVAVRAARSEAAVRRALDGLRQAAAGGEPPMPALLEAARAQATLGEMCEALRSGWGA